MQQKRQKTVQNCENGPKQPIFTSPLGTNGMKNISIASSIVVLQYRKYVVKKGSLFNVTLCNYATKTAKKISKNCENWPKQPIFKPPLGTNGIENILNAL